MRGERAGLFSAPVRPGHQTQVKLESMKRLKTLAAAVALLAAASGPATAQDAPADPGLQEGVAAIVNDEVISTFDVRQRALFILATSNIPITQENFSRVAEQALRALIEERLQIQEAREFRITIGDDDVDRTVEGLARQNGATRAQLEAELAGSGVSIATFREQLRAELAWQRLVGGRYGSRIRVSEDRVRDTIARIAASAARPRFLISEIFLEVESPDQQDVVYQGAIRLIDQMRAGAPFPAVARQFSAAASAAAGGDLGWVSSGELRPELEQVAASLAPGQLSTPIPVPGGFQILWVREKAEGQTATTRVTLREIIAPTGQNDEASAAAELALSRGGAALRSCDAAAGLAGSVNGRVIDLGQTIEADLSDTYRAQIAAVAPGRASAPFRTREGVHVLVVCARETEAPQGLPSRDEIEDRLYQQELAMLSRRYLRDLRRDSAVITR